MVKNNGAKSKILVHIVSLSAVFVIVASLAAVRNGRLAGHELHMSGSDDKSVDAVTVAASGTRVVNTAEICKDVTGYAGPVPLEISATDGRIDSVHVLDNSETPGFFRKVAESGLLQKWNGMTVEEAAVADVDGVTGATYSSRAVIANVRAGAAYLSEHKTATGAAGAWSLGGIAALAVALIAAIVPLKVRNIRYRIVQEILNVAVLGFWTGTFVNYTMMLNFMSNGFHSWASVAAIVMLVTAFVYPLFGHNGYYCAWVCPLGSLQDLAGRCSRSKWHMSYSLIKVLTWCRRILWGGLMICMWLGVWVSWVDYELFSAFVVESAPVYMLVAGCVVAALSVFVPRPYCRFVCPTGTLLRMGQDIGGANV